MVPKATRASHCSVSRGCHVLGETCPRGLDADVFSAFSRFPRADRRTCVFASAAHELFSRRKLGVTRGADWTERRLRHGSGARDGHMRGDSRYRTALEWPRSANSARLGGSQWELVGERGVDGRPPLCLVANLSLPAILVMAAASKTTTRLRPGARPR
jgi:hypothetical protein